MKAALQSRLNRQNKNKFYTDGIRDAIKTTVTPAYGPGRAAKVLCKLIPRMTSQERAVLRSMLETVARGEAQAGRVDGHLYVLHSRPGFVTISRSRPVAGTTGSEA